MEHIDVDVVDAIGERKEPIRVRSPFRVELLLMQGALHRVTTLLSQDHNCSTVRTEISFLFSLSLTFDQIKSNPNQTNSTLSFFLSDRIVYVVAINDMIL